MGAVTAPGAEDRVHGRVAPGVLEVLGAVFVLAGEVAQVGVDVARVRGDDGVEVPAAQDVEPGVQPFGGHRPAGRDDGDPRAGPEPGGPGERDRSGAGGWRRRGRGHRVSSSTGTSTPSMPKVCA